MFSTHFYHRLIRKYSIVFGTLFNNIYLSRYTSAGVVTDKLKVPLAYGPKEKFLTRIKSDPKLTKSVGIVLPRISFEVSSISYDASRKQQTLLRVQGPPVSNTTNYSVYQGVPYNIGYSMSVFVRNVEDGTQIAEQIFPYFQPDFTITALLVPTANLRKDIAITLDSVNQNIDYEGTFDSTRLIVWDFQFTLQGFFFGPVANTSVIKSAITNLFEDPTTITVQRMTMAANGISDFRVGEIVRVVGEDITATVSEWSNSVLSLTVTDATDAIIVDDVLRGDDSRALWTVAASNTSLIPAVATTSNVDPLTANSAGTFGYITTIEEFPYA